MIEILSDDPNFMIWNSTLGLNNFFRHYTWIIKAWFPLSREQSWIIVNSRETGKWEHENDGFPTVSWTVMELEKIYLHDFKVTQGSAKLSTTVRKM